MSVKVDFKNINAHINDSFAPLLFEKSRFLVLYGGAGSGKSHFLCQKHLLRILKAMDAGYVEKFMFSRKTQPALRRSVFELTRSYISKWELNSLVDIHKGDMSFSFQGGSEIICVGLDDSEKLKSIEGVTSAWIEEATEVTEESITQVNLRLRGDTPSYKQVSLSFNPISKQHPLVIKYAGDRTIKQMKEEDQATVHHSTWRDNRFIDGQYKEVLMGLKGKDFTLWQIYSEGIAGELKNIIYSNYEVIDADDWPEAFDDVFYGLDFGFKHPMALLEIGLLDDEIYERELIYESELETPGLIERLKELEINHSSFIYADPSRADIISQIYSAGFNIHPADNAVKPGIDFVKSKKPKISSDSINHIKEKQSYKYKEDKNGSVLLSEEPVKAFDHLQDAERYALFTYFQKHGIQFGWL